MTPRSLIAVSNMRIFSFSKLELAIYIQYAMQTVFFFSFNKDRFSSSLLLMLGDFSLAVAVFFFHYYCRFSIIKFNYGKYEYECL